MITNRVITPPLADLSALADCWQTDLEVANKSRHTRIAYQSGINGYLAWHARQGPGEPVLDKPAVAAYLADLHRAGQSPGTVRLRYAALRQFAKWLVREGELERDPLDGLEPPKLAEPLVPKLTDDELARLIAACKGTTFLDRRDLAIIRLMAETGLRAGEVAGMKIADLDVRRRVAVIRGKGRKERMVSFGARTALALDHYLRVRRSHRLADSAWLWLGMKGEFSYAGLSKALGKRAEVAGIPKFHPHRLRHTFASRWLAEGGSEGGLMAQAGWANRHMIDRYVRDTSAERSIAEARRLDLGRI